MIDETAVREEYERLLYEQELAGKTFEEAVREKCHFLAHLHVEEGWSYRRIGKALGVSAPWVQELADRVLRPEAGAAARRRRKDRLGGTSNGSRSP